MKIRLFFAILLLSFFTYAQDNPYNKPEMLKGKEVKIKSPTYPKYYKEFYADGNFNKPYKGSYDINTEHLEGRTFKVVDVNLNPNKYINGYAVKLQDQAGEIVYYRYKDDSVYWSEYYFEVIGGLTYPEDFFCGLVIEKIAADGHKLYSSTKNYFGNFIDKDINLKTKEEDYTLYISSGNEKTPPNKKGLALTLENGSKINFPHSQFYIEKGQHKAILTLKKEQVDLLSKNVVTGIEMGGLKFYTDDETFRFIKEILKCMITLKR